MAVVPMRILDPPAVIYGDRKAGFVRMGAWKPPHHPPKFYRTPTQGTRWASITFYTSSDHPNNIFKLASDLSAALSTRLAESGMNLSRQTLPSRSDAPLQIAVDALQQDEIIQTVRDGFDNVIRQMGNPPTIFLVILATGHAKRAMDASVYSAIKYVADVKLGVHTVCALVDKWANSNDGQKKQYISNVALKFNLKCGGINHRIQCTTTEGQGAMIVGADVTHPGRSSVKRCPSIAAVVATVGEELFDYAASLSTQTGRVEVGNKAINCDYIYATADTQWPFPR